MPDYGPPKFRDPRVSYNTYLRTRARKTGAAVPYGRFRHIWFPPESRTRIRPKLGISGLTSWSRRARNSFRTPGLQSIR